MNQKKHAISPTEKRRLAEQRRLRVIERKVLAAEREETSADIRAITSIACQISAEDLELQEIEER